MIFKETGSYRFSAQLVGDWLWFSEPDFLKSILVVKSNFDFVCGPLCSLIYSYYFISGPTLLLELANYTYSFSTVHRQAIR